MAGSAAFHAGGAAVAAEVEWPSVVAAECYLIIRGRIAARPKTEVVSPRGMQL